jgi:hypothetical protein
MLQARPFFDSLFIFKIRTGQSAIKRKDATLHYKFVRTARFNSAMVDTLAHAYNRAESGRWVLSQEDFCSLLIAWRAYKRRLHGLSAQIESNFI